MDIESTLKEYVGERKIAGKNGRIPLWQEWYEGYVPSFHKYKVYTGTKKAIYKDKASLPSAKIVSECWANLLFNEKTLIKVADKDKKLLDQLFLDSNFEVKGNAIIESSFALSIGAIVVRVDGLTAQEDENGNLCIVEGKGDGEIKIDTVQAQNIYPISYENGEITECAFAYSNTQESYLSIHLKEYIDENQTKYNYIIKNVYFSDGNFQDFEKVEIFDTQSNIPFFTIIHPNIVNNLNDSNKQQHISIYANAIKVMQSIDNKYNTFDVEFKNGKKRTFLSTKLQSYDADGNLIDTLDGTEEDIFFIPEDEQGHNLINTDASELRTASIVAGINSDLSILGYLCGFGKNYFSFADPSGGTGRPIMTATAAMMQNADLMRTMHKHEKVIDKALKSVVMAIVYASNTFTQNKFITQYKDIEIVFDDSIFEDKESEKETARKDIASGIMSLVEYRMKFYGETKDDARKMLELNTGYFAKSGNDLIPLLQAKAITPKDFVKLVYGKEIPELITAIEEGMRASTMPTFNDMLMMDNKNA